MKPDLVAALSLDCDLDKIRQVGAWLGESCKMADPARVQELELAIVEAVTNIIKHGHAAPGQTIGLELHRLGNAIEVVIRDRGSPIPAEALAQSESALDFDPEDIDNLPTCGLGLALIRESTDGFEYCTTDGVNVMRLIKTV
jgi:anti-sigma regulatory factor (Ser/Thr protein kinase)